ncbi:MAG: tetratricopeptide repeat protein [Candidatus Omnitrophota bacterium]
MKKTFLIILLFFLGPVILFAGEVKELSKFQEQARIYRQQGVKLQNNDDYDGAMSFYQKAVELDPEYAPTYNDLGVMYEAKGLIDQAEELYLRALKLDPEYLSAYSNLAFLYEGKRDLNRAGFYWKKRWEKGLESDPWTIKAQSKFIDLTRVSPAIKQLYINEETLTLDKEAAEYLKIKKEEELKKYQGYLKLANNLYKAGDYTKALEEANRAGQINNSVEVLELKTSISKKQAEKEKELKIKEMEEYFQKGVKYYRYDNPQVAQDEFDKIQALARPPRKNN